MKSRNIQNGLVALGAFIALASHINGWTVIILAFLFWNFYSEE